MFVAFANIEEPNTLTETEARDLHTELLTGEPRVAHRRVAAKIQQGWEGTGEVTLNDDEKRVLVEVFDRRSRSGSTAEHFRSVQQSLRGSLGEGR